MQPSARALLASFSFIVLCSACSTRQTAPQFDELSYKEALQAYHRSGRDESYRCIHKLADDQYKAAPAATPIAIVIDDALYLKISGQLLELAQTEVDEKSAHFANGATHIQAGYSIIRQFNFSEYRESDDRQVDFWVETPSGRKQLKTFGTRCGI